MNVTTPTGISTDCCAMHSLAKKHFLLLVVLQRQGQPNFGRKCKSHFGCGDKIYTGVCVMAAKRRTVNSLTNVYSVQCIFIVR